MTIEPPGMFSREQTQYCLVYELVLRSQKRMPIMKNHHAFLAIEISFETSSKNRMVSAVIFTAKNNQFTGNINDVDWLRNYFLRHRIVEGEKTLKFNINGRLLELAVSPGDADSTYVEVELKSIKREKSL
jgi:hypothetical protein